VTYKAPILSNDKNTLKTTYLDRTKRGQCLNQFLQLNEQHEATIHLKLLRLETRKIMFTYGTLQIQKKFRSSFEAEIDL
jgi:hypothetical protein